MKFQKDLFYMHEFQKDTIIEVLEVLSETSQGSKLRICFWNLGYTGQPWKINVLCKDVEVWTSSYEFWHNIDYDLLTVPRFVPGMPHE